ncbi:chaplin family protein [Streptomyces sp. FH025]|uniref:chaplin n=1 Tax=Streptomyces sp. FH025 TaxID=2815937 RepID=UPI0027DCF802|nr:chaplin family protein [Streptomyces sp. FH025]
MATGSVLASTAGYAYAAADAQGVAAGSAGVVSGNSVQVPVEVPINACGNTLDVIGALNPSFGNRCANTSGGGHHAASHSAPSGQGGQSSHPGQSWHPGQGGLPGSGAAGPGTDAGHGPVASGASASGAAVGSPGVISGNSVQAPVDVPVNACGNSVNVVGVGNPAFGNTCGNVEAPAPKPTEDCPEGHTPLVPPTGETPGVPRTGGPSTPATASESQIAPAAAHTPAPVAQPVADSQLAATGAGQVEMLGAAGLALLIGGGVLYRRARAGAR